MMNQVHHLGQKDASKIRSRDRNEKVKSKDFPPPSGIPGFLKKFW